VFRFGEETVEKMVEWCLDEVPPPKSDSNSLQSSFRILEVGSGNGILLTSLVEAGYHPSKHYAIHGIDYSPDAISLAKKVAAGHGEEAARIKYSLCDFLKEDAVLSDGDGDVYEYDLVLDKGTYDAMALGKKDENGRAPSARYPARVARHLREGGYFLITCESTIAFAVSKPTGDRMAACNFTEEELIAAFAATPVPLKYQYV
jgi:EEF1A lysine methyltransferase 2